jgi:hypothetical protein
MITNGAVSAPLLPHHQPVILRPAATHDVAGAPRPYMPIRGGAGQEPLPWGVGVLIFIFGVPRQFLGTPG